MEIKRIQFESLVLGCLQSLLALHSTEIQESPHLRKRVWESVDKLVDMIEEYRMERE